MSSVESPLLSSSEELGQYLSKMRFPPLLEESFQDEYFDKSLRIHRIAIWTAIVAFIVFHLLDLGMPAEIVKKLVIVRFGIFIPILLILFACSHLSSYKKIFNWMSSAGIVSAGLCVIAVQMIVDPSVFAIFNTSLLLIVLSGYTLARLRFTFATGMGWLLFFIYIFIAAVLTGSALLTIVISGAFLVLANIIGMMSAYFTEQYMRRDFIQRLMLNEARGRSDTLLLNVLPASVADRLKRGELIADSFPEVCILFADLVDFTIWSSGHSPEEVLVALNVIFSRFDLLVEEFGLEKIKTIGDAYMVVSGVPIPRTDHVRVIANMALAMLKVCVEVRDMGGDLPFSIRIGAHCGPVVAGVIGTKKFIYDLWGDTVNIASRMESHGAPDRIQVSEAVYDALQIDYDFEKRGSLPVKGRGEMTTYWLIGRKDLQGSVSAIIN